MLVAGLYNGNVAVYNLQVKISARLEVKLVSSEEHFEAKLHLLSKERKAPGAGLAGYKTIVDNLSLVENHLFVQVHIFKIILMSSRLKQSVVCEKTTFEPGEMGA